MQRLRFKASIVGMAKDNLVRLFEKADKTIRIVDRKKSIREVNLTGLGTKRA